MNIYTNMMKVLSLFMITSLFLILGCDRPKSNEQIISNDIDSASFTQQPTTEIKAQEIKYKASVLISESMISTPYENKRIGLIDSAVALCRSGIEKFPDEISFYTGLTFLYKAKYDYNRAIKVLDKLLLTDLSSDERANILLLKMDLMYLNNQETSEVFKLYDSIYLKSNNSSNIPYKELFKNRFYYMYIYADKTYFLDTVRRWENMPRFKNIKKDIDTISLNIFFQDPMLNKFRKANGIKPN